MSIDIGNALYTTGMILLAFVTAIVITKTITKYTDKEDENKEED